MNYYVEIYNYLTNEVAQRMGPMSESQAERVKRGASINLNHDKFATRIVKEQA